MAGKTPGSEVIRRAIGLTIRTLRDERGIAQEALALECNLDRSYVGQLERGRRSPTFPTIHKLLPGLKITFGSFALKYETILHQEMRRKNNAPPKP